MLARRSMLRHTSKFSTCAFVGLGNMGAHMANNLICQGHDVNAFDLNPKAFEALDPKVRMAKSVREAARDADVVITMLPANAHVLSVYLDEKVSRKHHSIGIDGLNGSDSLRKFRKSNDVSLESNFLC